MLAQQLRQLFDLRSRANNIDVIAESQKFSQPASTQAMVVDQNNFYLFFHHYFSVKPHFSIKNSGQ